MSCSHAATRLDAAILNGPFEAPLWKTFLDSLREETRSDYATLITRQPSLSFANAFHLFSGGASADAVADAVARYNLKFDPKRQSVLADGVVYSMNDLLQHVDTDHLALYSNIYRDIIEPENILGIRQMRLQEESGVDVIVSIARCGSDFAGEAAELLTAVAPTLRGALRFHVALERERFAKSLAAEAVRRLQFGWFTLDADAQVLDCDELGAHVLTNSGVLNRTATGRLRANSTELERDILLLLNKMAQDARSRPRAVTLRQEPYLDMLMAPLRQTNLSVRTSPVVIAYVHEDSWRSSDRWEQLGELFGLSPAEARLTLALCRGATLAEAAAEFGIREQTARGYSKAIYAKTGARGLPDLVRIVMRSVLAIEPGAIGGPR